MLVTAGPGLVALMFLDRDSSNAPLAAVFLLPVGPAVSAALYALHRRSRDLTDLHPAAAFWRGYRLNVWDSLRIWVPWLGWMTVVAVGLTVTGWWSPVLVTVGVGAALWLVNAMVIGSLFAFRLRDVARLAAYFLVRSPVVTLGTAGLLVAAGAVTVLTSEAVLALLASLLCAVLLRTCRPVIDAVRDEFTT